MKTQGTQMLAALAVLLMTGGVHAQSEPALDAATAFNRRLSERPEASQRQLAAESSAILLFRADANSDGRIARDEFVTEERADTDERFELRDRDGDGVLRRDEVGPDSDRPDYSRPGLDVNIALFRRCMQAATGAPPEQEDRFAEADLDGDGVLSLLEFSTYLEERAYAQFARLDDNQDGTLTYVELTNSFEQRHFRRRLMQACRDLASDTTL